MFEHWIKSDLLRLPIVQHLHGRGFTQDSGANSIGVVVTKGGQPETLTGTVSALVKKPNGTTIEVTGSKSENRAWVVLPSGAYTHEGLISVCIRLINGSQVTTLCCVEVNVYKSM